jgi:hypothetical protein
MSQHDPPLVALRHMLDHAREAVELATDLSQLIPQIDQVLKLEAPR